MSKGKKRTTPRSADLGNPSPATHPPWMKTKEIDLSPTQRLSVEYGLISGHLWMQAVLWKVEKNQWSRVGLVPVEEVKKHDAQLGRLVDFFGLVKREGKLWDELIRELNLKEGKA